MTRSTLIALTLAALHIVGCASSADTAAVVSSADEASDTTMDLVETHHEGIIEVELTVQHAGEWSVDRYEWAETEEPPPALLVALAELEAPLLENAREIEPPDLSAAPACTGDPRFGHTDFRQPGSPASGRCTFETLNSDPSFELAPAGDDAGPSAPEVSYRWPELLEQAAQLRVETERGFEVPELDGCEEHEGFTDCLRAAR